MPDNIVRTDPPVSEAQRRAMFAAKAGNSNIGIPQSVGEEFAEADPGGKLPEHKSDSGLMDRLDACQAAMDDCADRMDALGKRVDAMCARDDEWSEEARRAAAEARKKGSSGGSSEKWTGHRPKSEEVERSKKTAAAYEERARRYAKAGKPEKAAEFEEAAQRHRALLKKWGA